MIPIGVARHALGTLEELGNTEPVPGRCRTKLKGCDSPMLALVLARTSIALSTPCDFAPPGGGDPPALSINLNTEYAARQASLESPNSKTGWDQRVDLRMELLSTKLTAADRQSLVDLIIADATNPPQGSSPWLDWAPYLVSALACHGQLDLVTRLLTRVCPSGISGPLTCELHDLRVQGYLPRGVGVLFDAFDVATPANREQIRDRLAWEFAYFIGQGVTTRDAIVEWCREWYRLNGSSSISDPSMYVSGGNFPDWSPILIPLRQMLEKHLEIAMTADGPVVFQDPCDVLFAIERRATAWSGRLGVDNRIGATIVEPALESGRTNTFDISRIACDLQVGWQNSDGQARSTVLQYTFQPWSAWIFCRGDTWSATPVTLPADGQSVVILHQADQVQTARHVAAVLFQEGFSAFPGSSVEPVYLKIFPTAEALQFSVSLDAPTHLVAWGAPGQSLKIVADDRTDHDEVRLRINLAAAIAGNR